MKSLKLILIICLLTTMSCTHKVVKKESINRICYIDSVKMKTSLRKIILMYIHQHPSYKSYCLNNECSKYYLNNGQKEEDINDKDNYVILSPTYNYKGEYTDINNRMPSFYFKLNGRLIFLATNSDILRKLEVMDAPFKNKYASNMSSKEYISNSWLIKVSNFDDAATIIKKNLWGVTRIKLGAPGKFKAPIIKNKIRFKS
ncbi:hypothetical protein [Prevotella sp.]|uniref:hypothetical protein n=1 Tax=Prevotella sp. TaxID=59823 RepID=UPI003DA31FE6